MARIGADSGVKARREPVSVPLHHRLSLTDEFDRFRSGLSDWIEAAEPEVREPLRWQLQAPSKYYRPLTVFACHRAVSASRPPVRVIRASIAIELFHNVSLIIDDILDRSRTRRGKLTLHCRYGELRALMTAGYLTAAAFKLVAADAYAVALLGELMQRLGIAECVQWRLRRRPLSVSDWRAIASEDTGSMFELCAGLGTRDARLRPFGRLLGILYHGCDDVADLRGTSALGGGGHEDIRDGILTLPAAVALRDPKVVAIFTNGRNDHSRVLVRKLREALPKAEQYLDQTAAAATAEAELNAANPAPLIELVSYTRALSRA
jgi:geranylgeranyl pyrophosphate synthase